MTSVVIRDLSRADLPVVEHIRVRGWQHGYRDIFPASFLDAFGPAPDLPRRMRDWAGPTPPERHLVSVADGQVVGFSFVGPYRPTDSLERPGSGGEIYALYVDPNHWGHGVGARLLTDAIDYLTTNQLTPVRLWTLTGNDRARRLYEAYGFRCDDITQPFRREHGGMVAESTEVRFTLGDRPV